MTEQNKLIRLFPVPFRLISDEHQFKKWQWITARIKRAQDDQRMESHRLLVDTIDCSAEPLSTRHAWAARKNAISQLEVFESFNELETARKERGITLGLLRPARIERLSLTKSDVADWTDAERLKLMQEQNQGNLFDSGSENAALKLLRKLPYDFHYEYTCRSGGKVQSFRHKLVDWEAGALYWNVHRKPNWEALFRQRLESGFAKCDLLFLMGTIHRFPDQWLIVSVIYPPKPPEGSDNQQSLF